MKKIITIDIGTEKGKDEQRARQRQAKKREIVKTDRDKQRRERWLRQTETSEERDG